MSNKTFDILKYVAMIGLPSLATLVSALGLIWSYEYTDAVVATIVAVNTFLGGLLGLSTYRYNNSEE